MENETTRDGTTPEPEGSRPRAAVDRPHTRHDQTLVPGAAGRVVPVLGNDGHWNADENARRLAQAALPATGHSKPVRPETSRLQLPRLNVIPGGAIANFWHNFRQNFFLGRTRQPPTPQPRYRSRPVQPRPTTPNIPMQPTRYTWEQVEKQLAKYGITKDKLEQSGGLTDFLNGRRTGVIRFERTWEGQTAELTGKLYLVNTPDKGLRVHFQTVKQTLTIPETYLGYAFDAADRQNLHKRGELGKLVDLKDKVSGQVFKGYVGVDTDTNSLTVLRRDRLTIPTTLKGLTLTPDQQAGLEAGKAVKLIGLTGQDGKPFDAYVQVSARKRSLTFAKISGQKQNLSETQKTVAGPDHRQPSTTVDKRPTGTTFPAPKPEPPKPAPTHRKGPKR
jgi:hypothetical protein